MSPNNPSHFPNVSVSQTFFNVARIAELLRRRSRVTELRDKNRIFEDVDGRWAETGMIRCQMTMSCRGEMQRLETAAL